MSTPTTDYNIMGYTYMSDGEYRWEWLDSTEIFEEALNLLDDQACQNSGEYIDFRIDHVVTTVVG